MNCPKCNHPIPPVLIEREQLLDRLALLKEDLARLRQDPENYGGQERERRLKKQDVLEILISEAEAEIKALPL